MLKHDPEKLIGVIGACAAATVLLVRLWQQIAVKPQRDPWPDEADQAVRAPGAIPICVNCLHPLEGHRWLCPHCAFPSGEYLTVMPYLHIFAIGEFLRRGVTGPPDRSVPRFIGFAVFAAVQYSIFAPAYWFWMVRKACGRPIVEARRSELKFEED